MKEQDQIKALAELDGKQGLHNAVTKAWAQSIYLNRELERHGLNYLHSYDVIIPLVQKLPFNIQFYIVEKCGALRRSIDSRVNVILCTPSEVAEELLRATGKWKD